MTKQNRRSPLCKEPWNKNDKGPEGIDDIDWLRMVGERDSLDGNPTILP